MSHPISHPILVTGAAGGQQGSTGHAITMLLLEMRIPVRAFVHKIDARSDALRQQGAEIFEGNLLDPASVQQAMEDVARAYFTYPVTGGLLEAAAIFATNARDAGLEMVVNNSQYQGTPDDPAFRDLKYAPSFRNLQHRLADRIFDWAQVGAVHLQTPPITRTCECLSAAAWQSKIPCSCRGAMATLSFLSPARKTLPARPQLFLRTPMSRPIRCSLW